MACPSLDSTVPYWPAVTVLAHNSTMQFTLHSRLMMTNNKPSSFRRLQSDESKLVHITSETHTQKREKTSTIPGWGRAIICFFSIRILRSINSLPVPTCPSLDGVLCIRLCQRYDGVQFLPCPVGGGAIFQRRFPTYASGFLASWWLPLALSLSCS